MDYHAVRRSDLLRPMESNCGGFALNQRAVAQLSQRKTDPEVESVLQAKTSSILKTGYSPLPSLPPSWRTSAEPECSLPLRDQPGLAIPFAREAREQITNVGRLVLVAREFAWCSSDVLRLNPTATPGSRTRSRQSTPMSR